MAMPFQKSQSGNPNGRSTSETIISDALRVAIKRVEKNQDKSNATGITPELVRVAIGDIQAAKLIIGRQVKNISGDCIRKSDGLSGHYGRAEN